MFSQSKKWKKKLNQSHSNVLSIDTCVLDLDPDAGTLFVDRHNPRRWV